MSSLFGIGGGGNVGASGSFYSYSIDQSLRFDGSSSVLHRTPSSAGNRKTWSFSCWIKRSNLTATSTGQSIFSAGSNVYNRRVDLDIGSNHELTFFMDGRADGASYHSFIADRLLRDVSGWMHIMAVMDTTNATADDRLKLYVNGERQSGAYQYGNGAPPLNSDWYINSTYEHDIGDGHHNTVTQFWDGYIAEVNHIDGTALDPTSFGETNNGVWVPKAYSGSYGTNGFYLSFADSSAIGDDLSGNTNDWTANNLAASDVMSGESPTNNFATWNVTGIQYGGTNAPTVSEGSLKAATSGNPTHIYSTFAIQPTDTQGYYWEVKATSLDSARSYMGIVAPEGGASGTAIGSYQFYKKFVLAMNGNLFANNDASATNVVVLTSWTTNDILMFAYKDGKFWIGKNGTWMNSGDPAAGTGDLVAQDGGRPSDRGDVTWYPYAGFNSTYTANFGQEGTFAGTETAGGNSDENGVGDFKYSVPSGFLALCSANLPEPTIGPNSATQADDYFNTVLYTGDGTSSNAITGVGFQPDFLWIKQRSAIRGHQLMDSVRGASVRLRSEVTDAETASGLVSFDSDGFTVDGSTLNGTNISGGTFVGWSWKAGGTAVSNTNGSITSSVSANTDAGTSIVSFTGTGANATVGHGLSSAPEMIILKNRIDAVNWLVGSTYNPNGWQNYLNLNGTTSALSASTIWQDTAPTSSVFSVGSNASTNGSGDATIAYCFHSSDVCKVGSYVGNGNAGGVFVYTGHRVAFLILKRTDSGNNWHMFDNKRDTFNVVDANLYPNLNNAEATGTAVDFLSNGFKIRSSAAAFNASGGSYIYLAFAEAPFKYANAR